MGIVDWLGKPIDEASQHAAIQWAVGVRASKIVHAEDDRDLAEAIANLGPEVHVRFSPFVLLFFLVGSRVVSS